MLKFGYIGGKHLKAVNTIFPPVDWNWGLGIIFCSLMPTTKYFLAPGFLSWRNGSTIDSSVLEIPIYIHIRVGVFLRILNRNTYIVLHLGFSPMSLTLALPCSIPCPMFLLDPSESALQASCPSPLSTGRFARTGVPSTVVKVSSLTLITLLSTLLTIFVVVVQFFFSCYDISSRVVGYFISLFSFSLYFLVLMCLKNTGQLRHGTSLTVGFSHVSLCLSSGCAVWVEMLWEMCPAVLHPDSQHPLYRQGKPT